MKELNLYDIKPLVDVPDLSLYIFIALIVIGCLALALIAYLIYYFFKNTRNNERQLLLKELQNLDLNDAKTSAYIITKNGHQLIRTDREKKFFYALVDELEQYKYKKEVPPFSRSTIIKYETFMEELDV